MNHSLIYKIYILFNNIIKIKNEEYRLGGAANVANNLAALECQVSLIGIVGDDKNGELVREMTINNNIRSYIYYDLNFKTIVTNTETKRP